MSRNPPKRITSNRRRDTGRTGPPSGTRVHFWPGERTAWQTPGWVLPCRRKSTPPACSPHLDAVTCKPCLRAVERRGLLAFAPAAGGPWPVELLEAAGLRARGSPPLPPLPVPLGMRRPRQDPLEALGDLWRQRASVAYSRRLTDPASVGEARALVSCAAMLDDYLRHRTGVGL